MDSFSKALAGEVCYWALAQIYMFTIALCERWIYLAVWGILTGIYWIHIVKIGLTLKMEKMLVVNSSVCLRLICKQSYITNIAQQHNIVFFLFCLLLWDINLCNNSRCFSTWSLMLNETPLQTEKQITKMELRYKSSGAVVMQPHILFTAQRISQLVSSRRFTESATMGCVKALFVMCIFLNIGLVVTVLTAIYFPNVSLVSVQHWCIPCSCLMSGYLNDTWDLILVITGSISMGFVLCDETYMQRQISTKKLILSLFALPNTWQIG